MIIDYTYFLSGSIRISGLPLNGVTPSATNGVLIDLLQYFIIEYEKEYLENILGDMYSEFSEYIKSESLGVGKWDRLKDMLTDNISEGDFILKKSPIANYVYYWFLRDAQTEATITGVKKDGEDGSLVSPERKLVNAWNDMVKMNLKIYQFLDSNQKDYLGWIPNLYMITNINIFNL